MRIRPQQKIILIAVALAAVLLAAPALFLVSLALLVVLLAVPSWRLRIIGKPLFRKLHGSIPAISGTEREAIKAGTTWWEKSLLLGKPNWTKLSGLSPAFLSGREKSFLENETAELCRLVNNRQVQRQKDLPQSAWAFMKAKGFFGMIIPQSYGGLGFSVAAHAAVVKRLASRNPALAVTVMVPNSLGPAELLMAYGTEEQKKHYLPRLARGDEIPCFALSSIKAGSDAGAMEDFGIVCRGEFEGRPCVGLRLSWHKRYITLAPVATLIGLAVKVYDPERLLDRKISGGKKRLGITCALIPSAAPGVHRGRRHNPLSVYFQNGPTWGKDVFVPLDFVVGGAKNIGRGWRMLVECLSVGRSISLPALSEAAAQSALYSASAYARVREQFHRPIGHFEGVQEQLARLATLSHSVSAVNRLTVKALELGEKPSVVSSMVKCFCTENARRAVNIAMDLHGGKAIIEGERNYLSAMYKSLPILITVEGANILTRSLMIFGQGVMRCHPYLHKEFTLLEKDTPKNIKKFNQLALGHAGYHLRIMLRALGYAFVPWRPYGSKALSDAHPALRQLARHVDYLSALFAYLSDVTVLILGGTFKRREMISGRLADAWMALYASSALIHQALKNSETDIPLSELAGRHYCAQAENALYELCRALPSPWKQLTRLLLFPFGKKISDSGDRARAELAERLINERQLRLHLAGGIDFENYGALNHALELAVATHDLRGKIRKRLKDMPPDELPAPQTEELWLDSLLKKNIIQREERDQLKQWQVAVRQALAVDDYERL